MTNDPTAMRANLEKLTTDELEVRRAGMDNAMQGMVLHGIEVPADLEDEFLAVQEELARREPSKRKLESWTQLLGTTIDGFRVNQLLSDGTFSFVMGAVDESGKTVVFKFAKFDTQQINTKPSLERPFPTIAWNAAPFEGGRITPHLNDLVTLQSQTLKASSGGSLIGVEFDGRLDGSGDSAYYASPMVEGFTLRHLMTYEHETLDAMLISTFVSLCDGLHRLRQNRNFIHHSDVKPDNIIVTESGITLIDPGHSGELSCEEGTFEHAMVSTPQYYPLWEPDDLLAVGICFYEAALSVHPLKEPQVGAEVTLADDAQELIYFRQSLLQESLTPLLYLKRPSTLRPNITLEMEAVILKGLRLNIGDDGLLHTDAGFVDFAEFSQALSALRS